MTYIGPMAFSKSFLVEYSSWK